MSLERLAWAGAGTVCTCMLIGWLGQCPRPVTTLPSPQACYGILKVPTGSWLCRTCALGVQPKCLLCPKRGGALKPTRSGTKWVHVSCALWIPEVSRRGVGQPWGITLGRWV